MTDLSSTEAVELVPLDHFSLVRTSLVTKPHNQHVRLKRFLLISMSSTAHRNFRERLTISHASMNLIHVSKRVCLVRPRDSELDRGLEVLVCCSEADEHFVEIVVGECFSALADDGFRGEY